MEFPGVDFLTFKEKTIVTLVLKFTENFDDSGVFHVKANGGSLPIYANKRQAEHNA
jgi:hypothetical protein